jgi:hypothetical protein
MSRKYFGTDGVRGRVGQSPITPEFVMRLGYSAGKVLLEQGGMPVGDTPAVSDRQGHPPFRLHAGIGSGGRIFGGRRRSLPGRAAAYAGSGLPDPRPAPCRRASSFLLRTTLTTITASSSFRRRAPSCRTMSSMPSRRASISPWSVRRRPNWAGQAHRGCTWSLYRVLQEHLPQRSRPARPEDCRRLRPWRGLSHRAQRVP